MPLTFNELHFTPHDIPQAGVAASKFPDEMGENGVVFLYLSYKPADKEAIQECWLKTLEVQSFAKWGL